MKAPRTGEFDRAQVGRALLPFCPVSAFASLESIPLEGLSARGKRLILLDVDNTLVKWKGEDFSAEVLQWLAKARSLGFQLCILSNTRRPERLKRLSQKLQIEVVRDRFKPSKRMYRLALKKFGATPEEAVMIGDQILTDILGANRSGIEGIWVHKISDHEFFGTKFNRILERFVLHRLYGALTAATDLPESSNAVTLAGQFAKFAIVGGTSTVIDWGLFYLFFSLITLHGVLLSEVFGNWLKSHHPSLVAFAATPQLAALPVIQAGATSVAILNSFYFNRRWTFGIRGSKEAHTQLAKFLVISIIGLVLTTLLVTFFSHTLPFGPKKNVLPAKLIATVVVAAWNFGGQRLWAFKKT